MNQINMREEFKQYIEKFKSDAPVEQQELMNKAIQKLEESDEGKGLRVGEKVPNFSLPDATGKQIRLSDILEKGLAIVTFYRGGWCRLDNQTSSLHSIHITHLLQ